MEMVEKTVNFESAPFQMGFMHTMARVLLIIGIEKKPSIVSLAECVCVCHTLTVNHPISIYGIPCVFYMCAAHKHTVAIKNPWLKNFSSFRVAVLMQLTCSSLPAHFGRFHTNRTRE